MFKIMIVLNLLLAAHAEKAPESPGQRKAITCAACHGANGLSANPLWPNLAGQKREYIVKQLKSFKAGERKDPLMSPMASTLSTDDMEDLATYFSQLK